MSDIVCESLRAENPICFLAAAGLLRTCHERLPELGAARLSWMRQDAGWIAVLHVQAGSREELVEALAGLQFPAARDEFVWRDEVKKVTRADFRARAAGVDRAGLDWLAALTAENLGDRKDKPVTPFDTTAGQWKLLARFRSIHAALFPRPATPEHTADRFREALFEEWRYSDAEICFNWDPDLVPEGAYCAGNPAKTEKLSVLAATWLAIESLPLFPCDWTDRRLRTRGFVPGAQTELSWPVWTAPVSLYGVKSLLGMPELVAPNPPLSELRQRGVAAVFRSRRWNPTNYGALAQGTLCAGGR